MKKATHLPFHPESYFSLYFQKVIFEASELPSQFKSSNS
ncbi:hypothetical protein SAMN00777080_1338 [Aquiflexum balticum DSM 16537]|uniref:Uncharacterized protein n=1 Tax=Aquiflexum balticum DSM 16537 TaxID=758820 RepID=A0A1W2H1I6_9BACT|nr:hypothetical protein SAMN00777080_1338 [Aquiflexum balticum DSM 16537]